MYEEQGPDDMKSEYPSCIEECFYSSLEGSCFKREMTKARDEKCIGLPVPYDPSRLGAHLLGHRHGTTGSASPTGVGHRLIDFYYNSGEDGLGIRG
jgi:hypothetical protein